MRVCLSSSLHWAACTTNKECGVVWAGASPSLPPSAADLRPQWDGDISEAVLPTKHATGRLPFLGEGPAGVGVQVL